MANCYIAFFPLTVALFMDQLQGVKHEETCLLPEIIYLLHAHKHCVGMYEVLCVLTRAKVRIINDLVL